MNFENFTIKEIQDRAEEGILEIAKKYHLQALTLRFILLSRNLGLSNVGVAKKYGTNRNTINKYVRALENMDRDDIWALMCFVSITEHTDAMKLIGSFVKNEDGS